jgi:hypothetical protein
MGPNNIVMGWKDNYIRKGTKDEKAKLLLYELDKQKETELGDVNGYEISADGKKMIVGADGLVGDRASFCTNKKSPGAISTPELRGDGALTLISRAAFSG